MSAAAAAAGLVEALRNGRLGLTVILGEPQTIQKSNLAAVAYIGAETGSRGQVRFHRWRFAIRVVVSMHENTIAENDILAYASSVPAAIETDRTLGGRANVTGDIDQSAEGADGYIELRGADGTTVGSYRSIVFRLSVIDKN